MSDFTYSELPLDQNGHEFWRRETVRVARGDGGPPTLMSGRHECTYCGVWPLLEIGADAVRAVGDPCEATEGIITAIRLNVPSGKLIVADDLRSVYRIADEVGDCFADYNTCLGQAQCIEAMAALGCAYGPVGNTSPGLYRTEDGTYVVASPAWDEDTDDVAAFPGGTLLATVVTDLWAYSIADLEDWKARGGNLDALNPWATVVDVEPGVYEFTHHTGERGFDWDARPVIYAHIKRVS